MQGAGVPHIMSSAHMPFKYISGVLHIASNPKKYALLHDITFTTSAHFTVAVHFQDVW